MDPVIAQIRGDLNAKKDEITAQSAKRYFKEDISVYGVKTGEVIKIAQKYWNEVKNLDKSEIFSLCETLYQSGLMEEAFIVSSWMANYSSAFELNDINIFKKWINIYITNWATCDGFCNHAIGDFIEKYPDCLTELKLWTRSDNRWMRRASAVSLIIPARRGKYLKDIFNIADALLTDQDDMVRKGYGWMLKEASRLHQGEVFTYVMKNKRFMPRTSLRYAIELMPPELKTEAMKKDWKS